MRAPDSPQMRSLLEAIPEDPLAAFVLADYLEEQSDPQGHLQGELLRLVYTLTRSVGGENRVQQEERLRTLLLEEGVRAIGPYRRVDLRGKLTMEFAWVPPGVFLMGSPEDEEGREPDEGDPQDEGPQHQVMLTRGFWMGTVPVTQEQYQRVIGKNPSNRQDFVVDGIDVRRTAPVEEVEWHDAIAFLEKLTQRSKGTGSGAVYRLPTEAEWEYACRAGTTTRYWSGDGEEDLARVGWYWDNSRSTTVWPMGDSTTHPVGEKPANALGLFDMHGNVWEWCLDWYDPDFYARSPRKNPLCNNPESGWRVIRGGAAWNDAVQCRSALREWFTPDCSHNDLSFRVVADRL
jgi:formylglycine-generating enzyme required for sulfatase activity